MNVQRLLAVLCLSLGLLTVGVPRAVAQPGNLPREIVRASDLSQAQKDRIREFVDGNKGGLGGESQEIRKSRNTLLEPLRDPEISVQFRLEYTRVLISALRALASDTSEVVAVNAVRIAGELATAASVDLLLDALKDKRPGVRYMAASGFEGTYSAIAQTVPAIGAAQQALRTLDALKAAFISETDPRVLEGITLAYQAATKVPGKQIEGMRDAGVSSLSQAVSARIAKGSTGVEDDAAFQRALLAVRSSVINPNVNERELSSAVLREAAAMAGDLLALAYQRVKSGGLEPNDSLDAAAARRLRLSTALMVIEAERTVFFIQGKLSNLPPKDFRVGQLIQQSKDQEFLTQVMQIIGPNGVLTSTSFGNKDDRFVK